MQKKLAVVTVVYKFPPEKLQTLIDKLIKIGTKNNDIFVRDNTNDDIGYAAAINEVVRKKINEYENFLILNPDISFKGNFIKPLLEVIEQDLSDIVGPIIYDERGKIWGSAGILDRKRYSAGLNKRKLEDLTFVDFVPGTAMLIKKAVFKKIGFFTEDYFLYYDEVDFQYRAAKAGFRLAINPSASIIHFASYTVGKSSYAMRYYIARSHLLFVERFAPFLIKIRELIRLPRTIYQARNDKAELLGIRDYFLRRFGRNDEIFFKADKV